jgi:archaellum component FlaF (FlaF/FlaG flagellin family)
MAQIIAFLIAIGIIFSAEEATPEMIDQYQPQYEEQSEEQNDIVSTDIDGF